jgi:urease accessory protein
LPPAAPQAYVSTVHIGDEATGGTAVRPPLDGGWMATAWGQDLHRIAAAAARLGVAGLEVGA